MVPTVSLVVVVAGCSSSEPQVRTPDGGDSGAGEILVRNVAPGEYNSIGEHFNVCVEGVPEGEIVEVATPEGSGVGIREFAVVKAMENEIGGLQGRLVDLGADASNHTVAWACPSAEEIESEEREALERSDKGLTPSEGDGEVETLLFEVVAEGDKSARADYLTVHWKADGKQGEFDFPLSITLCTTVDQGESTFCEDEDS